MPAAGSHSSLVYTKQLLVMPGIHQVDGSVMDNRYWMLSSSSARCVVLSSKVF